MKTLVRALFGSLMVFGPLLIANYAVCAQVRIEDRFAAPGEVIPRLLAFINTSQ